MSWWASQHARIARTHTLTPMHTHMHSHAYTPRLRARTQVVKANSLSHLMESRVGREGESVVLASLESPPHSSFFLFYGVVMASPEHTRNAHTTHTHARALYLLSSFL